MKKLILITAILFYGITNAQEKGTWVFGGELNFSNGENDYQDSTSDFKAFRVTAKTGYVFTKTNLELGLGLGYSTSKNESYDYENKYNSYTISPYIKKYLPINDTFSFFLQGEVAFSNYNREESGNYSNDIDRNDLFIGIRPGFVFFVTKNIALNANIGALGYNTNKYETDNLTEVKSNSFNFNLNSSNLIFGLSYYL
ncbi:outer membrane beta-barrel protein [Polaribacter sp. Asnod1-A03]|uniref:outer membrane beta-barrel protein n=1 Tax=Polaribacter sp. Asnod1-A03 TaxID=3160581 RepID=UPI003866AE20